MLRLQKRFLQERFLAAAVLLFLAAGFGSAQSDTGAVALPMRAPGYELYYHNDQPPTAFATRWGYFDGWEDGRHDREFARTIDPADHDRYKLVPDHGQHEGLTRTAYKKLYQTAYLRGYEQGLKR